MASSSQPSTTRLRRRADLVRRRHEVARRWAQAVSHGRDDSYSYLEELCRLERLVAEAWPRYYARYREDWVRRDAEALHSEDLRDTRCPFCGDTASATTAA